MDSFHNWQQDEESAEIPAGVGPDTDGEGESPAEIPLTGSEDGFGEDFDAFGIDDSGAGSKSGVPAGVLLLGVVLAIGAGTLYFMRIGGNAGAADDPSAAAAEKTIEEALARLSNEPEARAELQSLFQDADQIVSVFTDDPASNQIAPDKLKKDPFELYVTNKPAEDESDSGPSAELQRQRQLRAQFEKLKLQSLLSGATPMAIISGETVREGDEVGPFKVRSISPYGVQLAAEGNTYTLRMNEGAGGDR